MHDIKNQKLKGVVLNIDPSKAYDRISWLFLRMFLTHLGFNLPYINKVMRCISLVSFVVLINSVALLFFTAKRGLRQRCPLSPLLFLLVTEGLNRALTQETNITSFIGIPFTQLYSLTHLLFVEDVLMFCSGLRGDAEKMSIIVDIFSRATGMQINSSNSTLSTHLMDPEQVLFYKSLFPYVENPLEEGPKYLGFHLKPNFYTKLDWTWLIAKLETRIKSWSFRWLSRVGRLSLVKFVLEAIPIYFLSMACVITGISSANGYKNIASSKHTLVHSWTKDAFPKGPKLYNQL